MTEQGLDDRKDWNKKFLSSGQYRKLQILSREYYVKTFANRIVEVYYIDENEYIRREPLSVLRLHPACVCSLSDGFTFYGQNYTYDEMMKDEREVARFENS